MAYDTNGFNDTDFNDKTNPFGEAANKEKISNPSKDKVTVIDESDHNQIINSNGGGLYNEEDNYGVDNISSNIYEVEENTNKEKTGNSNDVEIDIIQPEDKDITFKKADENDSNEANEYHEEPIEMLRNIVLSILIFAYNCFTIDFSIKTNHSEVEVAVVASVITILGCFIIVVATCVEKLQTKPARLAIGIFVMIGGLMLVISTYASNIGDHLGTQFGYLIMVTCGSIFLGFDFSFAVFRNIPLKVRYFRNNVIIAAASAALGISYFIWADNDGTDQDAVIYVVLAGISFLGIFAGSIAILISYFCTCCSTKKSARISGCIIIFIGSICCFASSSRFYHKIALYEGWFYCSVIIMMIWSMDVFFMKSEDATK